jgi:hypothetical protein
MRRFALGSPFGFRNFATMAMNSLNEIGSGLSTSSFT